MFDLAFEPENPSYDGNRSAIRVIANGFYNEYEFYVMDYGSHPCAYVVIPNKHPLRKVKDELDINIQCHGGITHVGVIGDRMGNKFTIGWDYAHYGDFCAQPPMRENFNEMEKRWTIVEILGEVCSVIDEIIETYPNKTKKK